MKKRLLAFLCMVVMVVGIFAVAATNANAAENVTYEAGYAKKSLMPWSDGANGTSTTLSGLGLPMSGYSNAEDRLGTKYFDDNGDGTKNREDGIFATCTVLTEKVGSAEGKTLVFFSVDMLNGYDKLTADVRTQVVAALKAANPNCNITASQIMVSGSHTHTGPYIDSLKDSTDTARADYYNMVVNQMVTAATEAYNSKAKADMKRGTVDVSDAIGYQMNWIRHYKINYEVYEKSLFNSDLLYEGTLIAGSNFGMFSDSTLDSSGWFNSTSMQTDFGNSTQSVAVANDTMELLTFEVEGADPIVLLSWRGHCDYVGGSDTLSSDYVNALRYRLENNKTKFGGEHDYNVSYIQGAAGNINIMHPKKNSTATPWMGATIDQSYSFSASSTEDGYDIIKYGYMLGNAAIAGLEGGKGTWVDCVEGAINTRQVNYNADKHDYTEGELAAAKAYYAAGGTGSFPYKYLHTDGKYYNLNSGSHAAAVLNYSEFPQEEIDAAVQWRAAYGLEDTENIPAILGSNTYARYAESASRKTRTTRAELNTIKLGDSVAMVSFPGEMFDRYDADGSMTEDSATSGWASLTSSAYGNPFVLGYTNHATGYIPNKASYSYNSDQSNTYSPGNLIGIGAYEANTSVYAVGEGEEVIAKFKQMLSVTSTTTMYCQHCDKDAEFVMLDQESINTSLTTGHYYLGSNISLSAPVNVDPGEHVCLQLNGYTLENNVGTRIVNVSTSGATETATLNIMDSSTGVIQAVHEPMYVAQNGVVNMYGGTLRSTSSEAYAGSGGTLYVTHLNASFTLHGGAIYGTKVAKEGTTCYGGAVYLWSNSASDYATFTMNGGTVYGGTADNGAAIGNLNSIVNINGGTVISGTLNDGGVGNCVFVGGSVGVLNISGDPEIDNIYINESKSTLKATADFEGQIPNGITYKYKANWTDGDVLGTCASGAEINATVRVYGVSQTNVVYLDAEGESLVASANDPNGHLAEVGDQTFNSLSDALANHAPAATPEENTEYVTLNKDVTQQYTIDDEVVYIDLKGCDLNIYVNEGCTVYVMDTATDDYNSPTEHSYGKLTVSGEGEVKVVPVGSGVIGGTSKVEAGDTNFHSGYVMLDNAGTMSFHRVDLGVTSKESNLDTKGVRYDCGFYGDQELAALFAANGGTYGVAVSIKGDPIVNDELVTGSGYAQTTFDTFVSGAAGNASNSSYINNIMKTTNSYATNKKNAEKAIYGRAYLQLGDGQLLYGPLVKTSLKESVQSIDTNWDSVKDLTVFTNQVFEFYNNFKAVVKGWNVNTIVEEAEAAAKEDEETLKILTLGNSHSIDAMNMLYEVYQQMNPSQKVELGILYYSGCPIDKHVQHIQNNTPAYVYYKINDDIYEEKGTWQTTSNTTVYTALQDEQWDLIVLQQMSNYSAFANYYTDGNLEWLIKYIKSYSKGDPELAFHMPWTHPMTDNYVKTSGINTWEGNMDAWFGNKDGVIDENDDRLAMQRKMHQMMINATKANFDTGMQFADDFVHTFISSSAVHYAFEQYILGQEVTNDLMTTYNEKLYRDYTHLSDYGRLMISYLWYAELNGYDGTTKALTANDIITTVPSGFWLSTKNAGGLELTAEDQQMIADAVNYALANRYVLPWSE